MLAPRELHLHVPKTQKVQDSATLQKLLRGITDRQARSLHSKRHRPETSPRDSGSHQRDDWSVIHGQQDRAWKSLADLTPNATWVRYLWWDSRTSSRTS